MKPPEQAVYIEWVDSIQTESWSRGFPGSSMRHVTAGWLLEEDEQSVVITSSVGCADSGDYEAAHMMKIPKCAIIRMQTVKPPRWAMP